MPDSMIKILITGVGGPLGQALIKAARLSAIPCRVIGTDRFPLSVGLGWVDEAHVIPDAAHPDAYLAAIRRLCAEEQVALVLPGSDGELALLANHDTGSVVAASGPEVIRIGLDKWETCRFLQRAGVNCPRSCLLEDTAAVEQLVADLGFPLIAKPRRGSGSQGLMKVRSREDIANLQRLGARMILQEYLQPDDAEYTVAVYTEQDGRQAGSICFKRDLVAGNTYRAWVNQNAHVLAEAESIVRQLGAVGPCNVQLRLTPRGAVAFEINPRFSGTTAMRAHFGFNEVEMAIRDYVLQEPIPVPVVRPGIALRFWEETYLEPDGSVCGATVPMEEATRLA